MFLWSLLSLKCLVREIQMTRRLAVFVVIDTQRNARSRCLSEDLGQSVSALAMCGDDDSEGKRYACLSSVTGRGSRSRNNRAAYCLESCRLIRECLASVLIMTERKCF